MKAAAALILATALLLSAVSAQECADPWQGEACNVYKEFATPEVLYSHSVPTAQWRHYIYRNNVRGVGLTVTVAQAIADTMYCDIDLYIQKNEPPRFSSYIAKDDSERQQFTVHTQNLGTGSYYISVYGYKGCDYALSFVIDDPCECVAGQGECDTTLRQCRCFAGYGGTKCEYKITPLRSEEPVFRVDAVGWQFYALTIDNPSRLVMINIMQGHDQASEFSADVRIALNRLPSFVDYDYVILSDASSHSLSISEPPHQGVYYVGVYNPHTNDYYLSAMVFELNDEDCINSCSYHGQCSNSMCVCNDGFSGPTCATRDTSLTLGVKQHGFVGAGAWNFYHIDILTTSTIIFVVEQVDAASDCDLFIKKGELPNVFHYDEHHMGTEQDFYVALVSPGASTWFIGLYGHTTCAYDLTVHEALTCQCDATDGHGQCAPASIACICDPGWGGPKCNYRVNSLSSLQVRTNQVVPKDGWIYYSMSVPVGSAVNVAVKESNSQGAAWVFLGIRDVPDQNIHDASDTQVGTNFHQLSFVGPIQNQNITIGVHGSPYALQSTVTFSITAWVAAF